MLVKDLAALQKLRIVCHMMLDVEEENFPERNQVMHILTARIKELEVLQREIEVAQN